MLTSVIIQLNQTYELYKFNKPCSYFTLFEGGVVSTAAVKLSTAAVLKVLKVIVINLIPVIIKLTTLVVKFIEGSKNNYLKRRR
jgi:hypothetical protein